MAAANHYVDNDKFYEEIKKYHDAYHAAKNAGKDLPQIPNYIGECFLLIAQRLGTNRNFRNYCVDTETEALTQRGWLKYDQITLDDKVLSYNIETDQMVWSEVFDIHTSHYEGKMFKLKHRQIDALVTPGHKFITKKNGLVEIDYIKTSDHLICRGEGVDPLYPNRVYRDEFVDLVGWYITEGNLEQYNRKKDGGVSSYIKIFQSPTVNRAHCERIVKNINALVDFTCEDERKRPQIEVDKGRYTLGKTLSYQINSVAPNKVLTFDFINALTQDQRLLLIDAMICGDGWESPDGTRGFAQKSEEIVDRFVYLCTISGLYVSKNNTILDTPFGHYEGFTCWVSYQKARKTCKSENIDFHGGRGPRGGSAKGQTGVPYKVRNPNLPTEDYNGTVWCLNTEYGSFMVRRNNKVYLTGNTWLSDMVMDGVENCVRYCHSFDPYKYNKPFAYFTQVIYYAFLRRIEKESKQSYIKYKAMEQSIVHNTLVEMAPDDASHFQVAISSMMDEAKFASLSEKYEKKSVEPKKAKIGIEKLVEDDE